MCLKIFSVTLISGSLYNNHPVHYNYKSLINYYFICVFYYVIAYWISKIVIIDKCIKTYNILLIDKNI